jgi:hypothetical protein
MLFEEMKVNDCEYSTEIKIPCGQNAMVLCVTADDTYISGWTLNR